MGPMIIDELGQSGLFTYGHSVLTLHDVVQDPTCGWNQRLCFYQALSLP